MPLLTCEKKRVEKADNTLNYYENSFASANSPEKAWEHPPRGSPEHSLRTAMVVVWWDVGKFEGVGTCEGHWTTT